MRLALISLLMIPLAVGCGKDSSTEESSTYDCSAACTAHYESLTTENCSGFSNSNVDDCTAMCEFYVQTAGDNCSEEVRAYHDNILHTTLTCDWWDDCSGGYDDTCDGFAKTPAIDDCMQAHGESSEFPDDHPDWPWAECLVTLQVNLAEIPSYCTNGVEVYVEGLYAGSSQVNVIRWPLIAGTADVQLICAHNSRPICESEVETVDLTSSSCGSSVDVSVELQDCPDELPSDD